MAFQGFPKSTLPFFKDLAAHNDKEWFDEHRAIWDEEIVPAMLMLCEDVTGRLAKIMPRLTFVPRLGGSLFRLNRDIRFSKDKSPYKTHVAALLWDGVDKHESPAIYLHVAASEVIVGGGFYMFDEAHLDRYRKLVVQEKAGEALALAVQQVERAGLSLAGEKMVRPPRGVSPDHPRAELSKHKGLAAAKTMKPGAYLYTAELANRAELVAKAYLPLHAWLRDELCA